MSTGKMVGEYNVDELSKIMEREFFPHHESKLNEKKEVFTIPMEPGDESGVGNVQPWEVNSLNVQPPLFTRWRKQFEAYKGRYRTLVGRKMRQGTPTTLFARLKMKFSALVEAKNPRIRITKRRRPKPKAGSIRTYDGEFRYGDQLDQHAMDVIDYKKNG